MGAHLIMGLACWLLFGTGLPDRNGNMVARFATGNIWLDMLCAHIYTASPPFLAQNCNGLLQCLLDMENVRF